MSCLKVKSVAETLQFEFSNLQFKVTSSHVLLMADLKFLINAYDITECVWYKVKI